MKKISFTDVDRDRLIIELCVALLVGIIAGCITYFALAADDDKGITPTTQAAGVTTEETSEEDGSTEEESTDEDFSNVKITVTDPGEYASNIKDWSAEEISAAMTEKDAYLQDNKYWSVVSSYWETTRGITGEACRCTYLFNTDTEVYSASDFESLPAEVVHIAKNEIYARHGYSFRDADVMNYFMGQVWYEPTVMPADFSEEVFSETEVKNLDLINSIDTM